MVINLHKGIFDTPELRIIRKKDKGAEYLIILFKMALLASEETGILNIRSNMPYTCRTLSSAISEEVTTVKDALLEFERYNLIKFDENGDILMNSFVFEHDNKEVNNG